MGVWTPDNLHKVEMQTSLFVTTRLFSAVFFECSELRLSEIIFIAVICRSATTEVSWDDSDICDQVKISLNAEDLCVHSSSVTYPFLFTKAWKIRPLGKMRSDSRLLPSEQFI